MQSVLRSRREAATALKASRGFWAIVKTADRVAPPLVKAVEDKSREFAKALTGADKREVVIEGLIELLPPLPWWAPEWLVHRLLGQAIDAAVAEYNKRWGKSWPGADKATA